MSRFEEAGIEARKSLEIDPRSGISTSMATVWHYFSRDYDRTLEELRKSALIDPTSFIPHLFLGYTLSAVGGSFGELRVNSSARSMVSWVVFTLEVVRFALVVVET